MHFVTQSNLKAARSVTNKQPLYRAKWKDTGKLFATYSTKEIADALFPSADRTWPNELTLEKIPQNETNRDYGREAEEE